MGPDASFRDYVLDQLRGLGNVTARSMFGGHGVYARGVMFGLVAGDELYLKVDESNQADFVAQGSNPFAYSSKDRSVTLSYWRVPEDVLEDPDELAAWARKSCDVALQRRARATKKRAAKGGARRESAGAGARSPKRGR